MSDQDEWISALLKALQQHPLTRERLAAAVKACEQDPGNIRNWQTLKFMRFFKEDAKGESVFDYLDHSADLSEQAVRHHPDHHEFRIWAAVDLNASGFAKRAEAHALKAIEISPYDAQGYEVMARSLELQGSQDYHAWGRVAVDLKVGHPNAVNAVLELLYNQKGAAAALIVPAINEIDGDIPEHYMQAYFEILCPDESDDPETSREDDMRGPQP